MIASARCAWVTQRIRTGLAGIVLAVVLAVLGRPVPGADGAGLTIGLEFGAPVRVEWEASNRDLVLRFDQPLDPEQAERLAKRHAAWLEAVSVGYDSLLLRANRPVQFDVASAGARVEVHLMPLPAAAQADQPGGRADRPTDGSRDDGFAAPPEADRRLLRARAQLLADRDRHAEARALLQSQTRHRTVDFETWVQIANADEALGRWWYTIAEYARALVVSPGDPEAIAAKARLLNEHGSNLSVEHDLQLVESSERQHITVLSGRVLGDSGNEVGFSYETRQVTRDALRRANGRVARFDDRRHRAELTGVMRHRAGQTTAALLLGPESLGFAVDHLIGGNDWRLRFGATYQRPYWDFVEGIADGGTVDRLEARGEWRLPHGLVLTAGLEGNLYSIDNDRVSESVGVNLALRRTLLAPFPEVSIGYSLDAEYFGSRDRRIDADDVSFEPLPQTSTEVHAIDIALSDRPADFVRYDLFAGYAFDRLNQHGPLAGVRVVYEPLDGLEVALRGSVTKTGSRGGDDTFARGGVQVLWRF